MVDRAQIQELCTHDTQRVVVETNPTATGHALRIYKFTAFDIRNLTVLLDQRFGRGGWKATLSYGITSHDGPVIDIQTFQYVLAAARRRLVAKLLLLVLLIVLLVLCIDNDSEGNLWLRISKHGICLTSIWNWILARSSSTHLVRDEL